MVARPHFLLFCDGQIPVRNGLNAAISAASASRSPNQPIQEGASSRTHWRFVLEDIEAGTRLEVSDAEQAAAPERAALWAVVRGLEALEQPSRVTLVTTSRYVSRGIQFGLTEWRDNDFCWEHFGSVQPIRNADLWRRIDHALQFHQLTCRWLAAAETSTEPENAWQIEPLAGTNLNSPAATSQESPNAAPYQPNPSRSVGAVARNSIRPNRLDQNEQIAGQPADNVSALANRNGTRYRIDKPNHANSEGKAFSFSKACVAGIRRASSVTRAVLGELTGPISSIATPAESDGCRPDSAEPSSKKSIRNVTHRPTPHLSKRASVVFEKALA